MAPRAQSERPWSLEEQQAATALGQRCFQVATTRTTPMGDARSAVEAMQRLPVASVPPTDLAGSSSVLGRLAQKQQAHEEVQLARAMLDKSPTALNRLMLHELEGQPAAQPQQGGGILPQSSVRLV